MALVVRDRFDTPGSSTLSGRVPDAGITGVAYESGSSSVEVTAGRATNTHLTNFVGFVYSSALASYGVGGELVVTAQFRTPSSASIAATKALGQPLLEVDVKYGTSFAILVGESPYFTTGLRLFDFTQGLVCTVAWTPAQFTDYTLVATFDNLGNVQLEIGATSVSGVRVGPGSALESFGAVLAPGMSLDAWELGADTGGLGFWTGFNQSYEVP